VEVGNEPPIILDLGTGLRPLGLELDAARAPGESIHLSAFLSHLHWDHIIGLPFFTTVHDPNAVIDIYGPPQGGMSLQDVFDRVLHPPFFPINVRELRGSVHLKEALGEDIKVGSANVVVRQVPHVGTTLGFRIEADGASVVFITDHQQPRDPDTVDPNVLELCEGADLLIHDAQYTPEEFKVKSDWGHSTVSYAVHVARMAGVRQLALFHHDPLHVDDDIDRLLEEARALDEASALEGLVAASEGLAMEIGRPSRMPYLCGSAAGIKSSNGNGSAGAHAPDSATNAPEPAAQREHA